MPLSAGLRSCGLWCSDAACRAPVGQGLFGFAGEGVRSTCLVRQSLEAIEEAVACCLSAVTVSRSAGSPGTPACSHTFLLTVPYVGSERAAASGAANKVLRAAWKRFKAPSTQSRQAFLTRKAARRNDGCAHILGSMRYPNCRTAPKSLVLN